MKQTDMFLTQFERDSIYINILFNYCIFVDTGYFKFAFAQNICIFFFVEMF